MTKTRKVTFRISDEQWRFIRNYCTVKDITAQQLFDAMLEAQQVAAGTK